MAMVPGSITVNTSTGGEIRAAGLAVDLYDALLASGGSFSTGRSRIPGERAGGVSAEVPPTWEARQDLARICNALAPAIIDFIKNNAVVSGASIT